MKILVNISKTYFVGVRKFAVLVVFLIVNFSSCEEKNERELECIYPIEDSICYLDSTLFPDMQWLKDIAYKKWCGTRLRFYQCSYKNGKGIMIEYIDGKRSFFDLYNIEGKLICTLTCCLTGDRCKILDLEVDSENMILIFELNCE